jgi:tetratricopeptide (TPR) repeat protein
MTFSNVREIEIALEAAEQKRSKGDFIGAFDGYCQIISTLVEQDLPPWCYNIVAKIVLMIANLSSSIGCVEKADTLLEILVYFYQAQENYPLASFTQIKRIHLKLEGGDFPKVLELFQTLAAQIGNILDSDNITISPSGLIQWEARCLWTHADANERSILFAHLYWAMGRLLAAQGQYHNALVTLDRGLWHTEQGTSSLVKISTSFEFDIASVYLEQGELDKALAKLADLQTAFDPDLEPELKVRWLELIGKICLLRGELGQALDRFQQIREICRKLGLAGVVWKSTVNLAQVLISINQTSLAKDYLNEVLAEASVQQDPELKIRLNLLLQLADLRSQSLVSDISGGISGLKKPSNTTNGSQAQVEKQSEDIELNFSFHPSNYLALFDLRVLQFYSLLSVDLNRANQLLSKIQSNFELQLEPPRGSDSQLIQVIIKILIGTLAYYQGVEYEELNRIEWAVSILDGVRPDLTRMGLKPELFQVQRILGWCWGRLGKEDLQVENIESNNTLLEELAGSFTPEACTIYLLNKWNASEESLASKINNINKKSAGLKSLIGWRAILFNPPTQLQLMQQLDELLLDIDRYKDAIGKQAPQDRTQSDVERSSVYSAWKRIFTHPRDRITLSFLVLPDRILIVRVGWLLFDYQLLSTTRLELRNLVQGWHSKIHGYTRDLMVDNPDNLVGEDRQIPENRRIANQLSELLKINLLLTGLPKRIKHISIVPDDILHGVPFAMIQHKGKDMIEEYAISIAYESQYKIRPKPSLSKIRSLLVGITKGTPPLKHVKSEIEKVTTWMKSYQLNPLPLMDISTNVDKETVIARLSQANLFHIACHGVFDRSQPDLSGFILSSQPNQPREILSLRELSALKLENLHHATLASCSSADYYLLPGRWIVSLPETLWRAGTGSILGCLWAVDDKVAESFMTYFYEYLEKYPRDKALQLTQQEFIDRKVSIDNFQGNLSNPLYWSGFTLYGDYKNLDLVRKINFRPMKNRTLKP